MKISKFNETIHTGTLRQKYSDFLLEELNISDAMNKGMIEEFKRSTRNNKLIEITIVFPWRVKTDHMQLIIDYFKEYDTLNISYFYPDHINGNSSMCYDVCLSESFLDYLDLKMASKKYNL